MNGTALKLYPTLPSFNNADVLLPFSLRAHPSFSACCFLQLHSSGIGTLFSFLRSISVRQSKREASYLSTIKPAPGFLPIPIRIAFVSKGLEFSRVVLKATDSLEDVKNMLHELVKEIGDEIVSIPSEASFILYWYALTYCLLLQLSLNESPSQYAKGNRRSSCSAAAAWSQSRGGFTCERWHQVCKVVSKILFLKG